jgi:chromosome segregation ATPase
MKPEAKLGIEASPAAQESNPPVAASATPRTAAIMYCINKAFLNETGYEHRIALREAARNTIEDLETELTAAKARIAELEESNNKTLTNLGVHCETLQVQLARARAECERLTRACEKEFQSVEELSNECAKLKVDNYKSRAECERLKAGIKATMNLRKVHFSTWSSLYNLLKGTNEPTN